MPWHIGHHDDCPISKPHAVIKDPDTLVTCHATRKEAQDHMAALYASEPTMRKAAPLKATILDDDRFALLAIPFGGPIPSPTFPRGVDLDGETFTERTDIKAEWFDVRLVDWHHGRDELLRRTVIGKAENLREEEDGWWVDVWLRHGERRLDLIKRLAERGAQLFGSSESVPGLVRKAASGELLVWPYVRQTLTTSPQNIYSVPKPLKATIEDYLAEGVAPGAGFWSDIETAVRDLGSDLRDNLPTGGESGARKGQAGDRADADLLGALGRLHAAFLRMERALP